MQISRFTSSLSNFLNKTYLYSKDIASTLKKNIYTVFSSQLDTQNAHQPKDTKEPESIAGRVKIYRRNAPFTLLPSSTTALNKQCSPETKSRPTNNPSTSIPEVGSFSEDTEGFILPIEITAEICTLLDSKAMSALSKTSKYFHNFIQSNPICQNRILYEFAIQTACSIQDYKHKSRALKKIAESQLENGDTLGAEETTLLLPQTDSRKFHYRTLDDLKFRFSAINKLADSISHYNNILFSSLHKLPLLKITDNNEFTTPQEIIKTKIQNGDIVGAKKIALSLENDSDKSHMLIEIAIIQMQHNELEDARETFSLAKETALLIKNDYHRSLTLKEIIKAQAQNGDIVGAKDIVFLLEDNNDKSNILTDIAIVQMQRNEVKNARETFSLAKNAALLIEDEYVRSTALREIVQKQAQNGDILGAEGIALSIKDNSNKSNMLTEIAIVQMQRNEIENARETFSLAKNVAFLIENDHVRSIALQEIANAQIQNGDIVGAKRMALSMRDTIDKSKILKKVAIVQIRQNDLENARKTFSLARKAAFLIEETSSQSEILEEIVGDQARNGDTIGAKEAVHHIKDAGFPFSAVVCALKVADYNNKNMGSFKNSPKPS